MRVLYQRNTKDFGLKEHFDSLYSDSWNILEVLITDTSPIDLSRLPIENPEDAYCFIQSYGYELNNPEEAAEIEKIRREALRFIQRQFLDTLGPEYQPLAIPAEIKSSGVLDLLQTASGQPRTQQQRWACAVLRVMHTLAHVVSDLSLHFFPSILDQILGPYYRHIHHADGQMWLGEDDSFRLPLVDFQIKSGKDRDSALLKLLHKAENVAADIFDRIGVRFVTRDRLDAILVLHYLRERHLVAFPNVKPSRSVNTLIDIDKFRKTFRKLYERFEAQDISIGEFEQVLRHSAQFHDNLTMRQIRNLFQRNPYTSGQYRSLQFTVRQLVRLINPLYAFMDQLDTELGQLDEEHRMNPLLREPLEHARPYYRFFFPYEIQIVDLETHNNNMSGLASHNTYKLRQVQAARKRVLGSLVKKRPLASLRKDAAKEAAKEATNPQKAPIKPDIADTAGAKTTGTAGSHHETQPIYSWLLEESDPVT